MNGDSQNPDDRPAWDALEGLWRHAPVAGSVPEALRARVRREALRMRAFALCEWLLAGAFLAGGAWRLVTSTTAHELLQGSMLVGLTAIALWLATHARRGLWAPAAESTQAYLDVARARLRGGWRVLAYAWLLFAFELLLLLGIQLGARAGRLEVAPHDSARFALLWLGGFTLALGICSAWHVRRLRRESAALDALVREIAAGDDARATDPAASM